jgi:hypothetical protein
MKTLITVCLLSLPAAAQAMGCGGCGGASNSCSHLAAVLYAAIAALGYWVLQHSGKETAALVKNTGRVVAFTFLALGLMGFLCGIACHIRSAAHKKCGSCPQEMMGRGAEGMSDGAGMMKGGTKTSCPMHHMLSEKSK